MTSEVAAALTPAVVVGAGLLALALVVALWPGVGLVLSLVHEGGHMVLALLTGVGVQEFRIFDSDSAVTVPARRTWWPGRILVGFAGYAAPPLVGWGGAVLLAGGRAWPLLWGAVVVLVLAWIKARGGLAETVCIVTAVLVGAVAIYGPPWLDATVAATLVWVLLFGGIRDAWVQGLDEGSDAQKLARDTLIPRRAWRTGFLLVGIACALQAAERLL